jgi:hypothetical protein
MSRLRDEAGISLVELLISMSLMVLILSATMGVVELVQRQGADAAVRVDSRDEIRVAMDRMIRPLRTAVETPAGMVEAAGPFDLVYQSVGDTSPAAGQVNSTALQRVRVCLDTTTGKLYRQTKTFTDVAPALATPPCGSTASGDYTTAKLLGTNITNGVSRPLFTYDYRSGSTALKDLEGIAAVLYVDANGPRPPAEVSLSTAVTLRNVNQAPVASFTDAEVNGHALLNASSAVDPEGGDLTYAWYVDGGTTPAGSDIRFDRSGLLNGSTHTFTLIVTDTGGLTDTVTRSITMP